MVLEALGADWKLVSLGWYPWDIVAIGFKEIGVEKRTNELPAMKVETSGKDESFWFKFNYLIPSGNESILKQSVPKN